ncbi:hypothetical protein ACJJTC_015210, partial [Scirpophaga incertulas]
DIKLHYVENGDPSKPLMIFLHGFPEFWYSWRYQILEFSKDYWCIAMDMRGYGHSERPEGLAPYKIELLVADVRDLIRQLGREKCTLVAHDWGGLIACRLRDVYPEIFNQLIILASASREVWNTEVWENPIQRRKSWYVFMYRFPWLAEYMLQLNNLAIFDRAMIVPGKDSVTPEDIECYKYWFGKQYAFTPPVNYYRANFVYDMPNNQPNGNVPMLVIYGEKDAYLELSLIDRMKKRYGNIETAIIENCAHFLQQEEPQKVNKLIRDFLSNTNSS